ncbi:hypothetical protein BDZ89DRAFT_1057685, partial [Hymenopellis radicata]
MARTSQIKKSRRLPPPFADCSYHDDGTGWGDVPRTIVELRMCQLSAILRDKPEWYNKINDPVIRAKWREEALATEQALPQDLDPEWKLTEAMVDYVLDEMEAYTMLRDEATGIQVACYERIWQSDSLIPQDCAKAFSRCSDDKKDWHPGSDGQVLDLVHPSLYPVRYGHSVSRNAEGSFEVLQPPNIAGDLLAKAVPMFERVLSDLRRPTTKLRMRVETGEDVYYVGTVGCVFVDDKGQSTEYDEWRKTLQKRLPEVDKYDETVSLAGSTIQVIVKLANIVLTPDKPNYKGGSWHVEGIVSTFIYVRSLIHRQDVILNDFLQYYDEENLTESRLDFRTSVLELDIMDSPLVQEIGSLKTCQGRCPFGLADPAKPGHRKITCSVDEHCSPQQAEWVNDIKLPLELVDMIAGLAKEGTMSRAEAETVRAELMKERSLMNEDHTSKKYSIEFNL